MINFEEIRNPLDKALRKIGFRPKGKRMWVRTVNKTVQVAHLDKSSYGPQHRLEVYVTWRADMDLSKIKLSDFDIVIRVERIVRSGADLRSALDQETGMPSEARELVIEEVVTDVAPVLELASNEASIVQLCSKFPSQNDVFIGRRALARSKS